MKKIRKSILAACTALAMALAVPAAGFISFTPVLAADSTDTTIEVENPDTGSTFAAYQIFKGTVSGSTLTDIEWGAGVNGPQLLSALQGSTTELGDKTSTITMGSLFTGYTSASQVAAVLSGVQSANPSVNNLVDLANSAEFMKAFAAAAKSAKTTAQATLSSTNNFTAAVDPGYYLIIETDSGASSSSASILQVVSGTTTVSPKTVTPTTSKQVSTGLAAAEDTEQKPYLPTEYDFADGADHNIGEVFKFKLTAKIPVKNLYSYDTYPLTFDDTLPAGIDYVGNLQVFVLNGAGTTDAAYTNITSSCTITASPESKTIQVKVPDILQYWTSSYQDIEVIVTFNAKLNAQAEGTNETGTDTANKNSFTLTYPDNPDDSTSNGTTTEESAYVYTYEIKNTKKINTADGNPLPGAEFELYQGTDEKGTPVTVSPVYKEGTQDVDYYVVDPASTTTTMVSGTDGTFNIKGLSSGNYYLVETKAPEGFVVPAKGWSITITDSVQGDNVTVTESISGNGTNVTNGALNNAIVNTSSSSLPSTGGMGTTVFYTIGGCLVAGAAILFVTNKRMRKEV